MKKSLIYASSSVSGYNSNNNERKYNLSPLTDSLLKAPLQVELAKQGYQYFAEGKIEAVLGLFDPKIEWHECIGFPFVSGDGIYIGPTAIAQDVFSQIPNHYEGFQIDVQELFGCGDKVVMVGYYRGVWKATGKKFKASATHVWTFKDGKVIRSFQAVDTAAIMNP